MEQKEIYDFYIAGRYYTDDEFGDSVKWGNEFDKWLIAERKRVAEHAKKEHLEYVIDTINELISDAESHDGECNCRIAAQAYRDLLKHLSMYDRNYTPEEFMEYLDSLREQQ